MVRWEVIYWVIGIVVILFYSLRSYEIHGLSRETDKLERKLHQAWLNGLGSLLGWAVLFYFLKYRVTALSEGVDFKDLIILITAFIGISGYLPHIVIDKLFKPIEELLRR